ncbi:MAG: PorV/PorQ family protein [Candidatus Zixiibacteriota bacterium]
MKRIVILLMAFAVLIAATTAHAENDNQFGTAGAHELRIPMGTRNIAMAGAGIAGVRGLDAVFWNPAGLSAIEGTQVQVTHLDYLLDIAVNNGAVATRLGDLGILGVSVKALTMDDIPVTTWENPEGTGEFFAPAMTVVGLTFARQLTDRVSFGATGMYINEDIHRVSSHGVAFDFGFTYDPQIYGLKFGAVMKNYGPDMQFDGNGFDTDVPLPDVDPGIPDKTVRTESAPFELPSYVQFGLAYEAVNQDKNLVSLFGSFQSNNYTNDEYRIGGEYAWDQTFFLRAGYVQSDLDEYISDVTLGGGLRINWGASKVILDYAWANNEFFDANQWFTVGLEF